MPNLHCYIYTSRRDTITVNCSLSTFYFSCLKSISIFQNKNSLVQRQESFLVGEAGLEPARPQWTLEPESSESTNSTTRPYLFLRFPSALPYHTTDSPICQHFFCFPPKIFRGSIREPLNNSARADSEEFWLSWKFWKWGNTLCISHFQNWMDGSKDPRFTRRRLIQRFPNFP